MDVRYCVTLLVGSLPRRFAAAAFILIALAFPATAADVTVVWDPNPESDIAGYIVSYGTSPGVKTALFDGSPRTSQVITGLTVGTKYYFRVEAYNSSGMKSVPSDELPYTVVTTTVADKVSPVVTSGTPTPNATGVSVSTTVRVVFSEPMNAATITSTTVALLKGTTAVASVVTYDATTKAATITPTTALAASTKYTVRVLGGTADPRPKDLAGNALVSTTSWSFTTGTAGAAAPPKPTITSPATGLLFRGGQVLTYAGTATDPNETLTASAYTWTVTRYDGTTPTIAQGPVTGATSGSFTVPTTGKVFTATTYYEIKLTVKDKTGLSASTTVQVKPRMANLSLASSPSGLQLSIDGVAQAAPFTRPTLSGFTHTLVAASPQLLAAKSYAFDRWSDTGAATHTVTVPDAGLSLTASFALAAVSGPTTSTFRVATGADDVNEVSGVLNATSAAWVGTGGSATASFAGLRFSGVAIPQGAQIISARLEVQARVAIFTPLGFEFGIQNAGNAAAFTSTSRPSQRTLATPRVAHSSNTSWAAGQWYALNDISPLVQALVNRTDWLSGNSLALVMRGTYGTTSRMFIGSVEQGAASAAKLVVTWNPASDALRVADSGTVTLQTKASADDVNRVDGTLSSTGSIWLGNGASTSASYTGLRFTNVSIPAGAVIESARLEVNAPSTSWIAMSMEIAAEAADNAPSFSSTSMPGARALTYARVYHSSNTQWTAGSWYLVEDVRALVEEVVARGGWTPGNSLALVLKGTGSAHGRKTAHSFDSNPANAPRLVVTYR